MNILLIVMLYVKKERYKIPAYKTMPLFCLCSLFELGANTHIFYSGAYMLKDSACMSVNFGDAVPELQTKH
jgi:hypothetical protein